MSTIQEENESMEISRQNTNTKKNSNDKNKRSRLSN